MTEAVQVALIASVPATIVAIGGVIVSMRNSRKIKEVHDSVNGKLTAIMESSKAVGNLEGRKEQTQERKEEEKK